LAVPVRANAAAAEAIELQIAELTTEIEQRVACQEELLQRLDTIPGIDRIKAWTVLAEIGTDMSVFRNARQLASWAALCPGNRESGGKRMSGRTRKGKRVSAADLCQSAWAASHTKIRIRPFVPADSRTSWRAEGDHGRRASDVERSFFT
jgi:transposase